MLVSDDYLPALSRPNVELVTDPLVEVRPHGLVTRSGTEYPADTLILGTGFRVSEHPAYQRVRGRDGRSLAEHFAHSPQAHLGVTVVGFHNLFLLMGPNSLLAHNSVVLMIESQVALLLGALDFLRARGLTRVEPRPEAQAAFVAAVEAATREGVWTTGGCTSWYLDATGRNSALWPGFTFTYRHRVQRFNPAEYLTT